MTSIPIIKPHKSVEYQFKQSKYDVAPRIPFSQVIVGKSGSGKTILLQNMILDIYAGCFERIYIFSASINVDSVWHPVKKYIKDVLKVDDEKEKIYYDDFHKEDLENILNLQYKISKFQKDNNYKTLYSTLIVIDDFVDQVSFSKHNSMLNALYIRGRHFGVNVISSSQKFNGISTIIRINSRQLFFFKITNYREIMSLVEELSALLIKKKIMNNNINDAKKTLLEIYEKATEEKYSFLFVNLLENNINDVFKIRFQKRLIIDEDEN